MLSSTQSSSATDQRCSRPEPSQAVLPRALDRGACDSGSQFEKPWPEFSCGFWAMSPGLCEDGTKWENVQFVIPSTSRTSLQRISSARELRLPDTSRTTPMYLPFDFPAHTLRPAVVRTPSTASHGNPRSTHLPTATTPAAAPPLGFLPLTSPFTKLKVLRPPCAPRSAAASSLHQFMGTSPASPAHAHQAAAGNQYHRRRLSLLPPVQGSPVTGGSNRRGRGH